MEAVTLTWLQLAVPRTEYLRGTCRIFELLRNIKQVYVTERVIESVVCIYIERIHMVARDGNNEQTGANEVLDATSIIGYSTGRAVE